MTRSASFRGILRYLRPHIHLVVLSLLCALITVAC